MYHAQFPKSFIHLFLDIPFCYIFFYPTSMTAKCHGKEFIYMVQSIFAHSLHSYISCFCYVRSTEPNKSQLRGLAIQELKDSTIDS